MRAMPRKSRLTLPKPNTGPESIGHRIARLRKEKGYTQVGLAQKIGLTQNLVSAYECDRLRLNAEMVIHFAQALEVSADELLGLQPVPISSLKPSLKLQRRWQKIESLPMHQQKILLKTIDMFLIAAENRGTEPTANLDSQEMD